jgi:hypothetical protein
MCRGGVDDDRPLRAVEQLFSATLLAQGSAPGDRWVRGSGRAGRRRGECRPARRVGHLPRASYRRFAASSRALCQAHLVAG